MTPHDPATKWVVLLVDDEPDVLVAVGELLEWGIPGLTVVTATSGQAGLRLLQRRRVDLIVSDFKMPNMDGMEFLRRVGLEFPRIPRAILTAFLAEGLTRTTGPDSGIGAFLSKASPPNVLVDWVRHRLESVPAAAVASLGKAGIASSGLASR